MRTILVIGGAGFIGANFVHYLLETHSEYHVVVYDKLTYAGNLDNLRAVWENPRFAFVRGDICDRPNVEAVVRDYGVDTIVNFAAETHVDRSILDPDAFIHTNVYGTYVLLEVTKDMGLERFHQVSTDEVYGDIPHGYRSKESDPLRPRSPYSAAKASGDLLTLSYFTTFQLPVTITRASNNIGPYQHLEKVVPLFTTNALEDKPLPVYGDGRQMRDYMWVGDHCRAIDLVLHQGTLGEVYNVGTGEEIENLTMVEILLDTLGKPRSLVQFVEDRPGHDRRYALDISKIKALGWEPQYTPREAVAKAVRWYVDNEWWWRPIKEGDFQEYYQRLYGSRKVLRSGDWRTS